MGTHALDLLWPPWFS